MKQITVVLNGPPGCGKDTIANALKGHGFAVASFKNPMYQMASSLSGVPVDEFIARHSNRDLKEQGWEPLAGMSTREFLIHISERVVKPLYGQAHFGNLAAKSIGDVPVFLDVVFSDGGFLPEFEALPNPKLLVRLHADWAEWGEDSRGYVYPPDSPSIDLRLVEGMPEKATLSIIQAVKFLRELES